MSPNFFLQDSPQKDLWWS